MRHQPFVLAAALLALAALVTAGNLNPPAGVVMPTMKTLDQIEPRTPLNAQTAPGDATNQFRITQRGSYYLTGDITGVAGKNCIEIAATGVILDLNGYRLEGVTGSLAGIITIHDHGTIRNGTVHNFAVGINALEAVGIRLQNISSTNHDGACIRASVAAIIENCTTEYGDIGFDVFESATITNCTSRYAESYGFRVEDGCTLTNCTAVFTDIGFAVNGPSVLTNCTSQSNSLDGFRAQESSILTDCIATNNAGAGFTGIARNRFTRCNARDNGYGFSITEANSVVECTASSNDANGVRINGNANTVERSTCHENTSAGINISTGAANNIDSNLLTYNGTSGLFITTGDNIATRNRARGNSTTNYTFGGNNEYGVIITNPGAGFTSTSPWANFAY